MGKLIPIKKLRNGKPYYYWIERHEKPIRNMTPEEIVEYEMKHSSRKVRGVIK
jgi:hypothetical protein